MQGRKVIIHSLTGRVYEYDYPRHRKGALPRKKTKHHPDFKPKPKLIKVKRDWRTYKSYTGKARRLVELVGKCQQCGVSNVKLHVHHRDGNGTTSLTPNHSPDNLIVLCPTCHLCMHQYCADKAQVLKLKNTGLTMQEIADKLGISRQRVHQILKAQGNYYRIPQGYTKEAVK